MHQHASSNETHWLPAGNGLLKPHPHCRECGFVKNMSADRARGMGYYMNILSDIRRRGRGRLFTDVQIRLIAKMLEKIEDFEDDYYMTFENQKRMFVDAVRKYSRLSPSYIESYLN